MVHSNFKIIWFNNEYDELIIKYITGKGKDAGKIVILKPH